MVAGTTKMLLSIRFDSERAGCNATNILLIYLLIFIKINELYSNSL